MTSEEKLDKILDVLNDISKWTKLQGLEKFSQVIPEILENDKKKIVFELSNGMRSAHEISIQSEIPKNDIIAYWKKWVEFGIVEESEQFVGRMKHLGSLAEARIDVPESFKKKLEMIKNE